MMVTFVSQCEKKALGRTRKVLDAFADRIGDNTWQTVITQEGLLAVKKLLRKTATKNTAVSCHWIRSRSRSELVWVVGRRHAFDQRGRVAVNRTRRESGIASDEGQWSALPYIMAASAVAALFHDFGKANPLFQTKLKKNRNSSEPYRHEWLSLRLFEALVGQAACDTEWLKSLVSISINDEKDLLEKLIKDHPDHPGANPFKHLPPFAKLVAWLILTHHRMPELPADQSKPIKHLDRFLDTILSARWNSPQAKLQEKENRIPVWSKKDLELVWEFERRTPVRSSLWCKKASSLATQILHSPWLPQEVNLLEDRFSAHLSRLVLMLADHYYSAQPGDLRYSDKRYSMAANTVRATGKINQRLDDHLIGVYRNTRNLCRKLPHLKSALPALGQLKNLEKNTSVSRFSWQNKAYHLATELRARAQNHGFFGVNLASTGMGKTFANLRIMYGLSDEVDGLRVSVALGLRTLTLQTGDALREKLGLGDDDLAVMIGSSAVSQLHDLYQKGTLGVSDEQAVQAQYESSILGSELSEDLLEADRYLHYDGSVNGPLATWLASRPKLNKMVCAPVLVSTIDHLMPATEGVRGGKQIAPMLRLLSADLILDEPDDFGLDDLPALSRLVNWCGLLGGKVLLSSATLPPALVQALFESYIEGRRHFQKGCASSDLTNIPCAWFDEFGAAHENINETEKFSEHHTAFVEKRIAKLGKCPQKRALRWLEACPESVDKGKPSEAIAAIASTVQASIAELHSHHHEKHPKTSQKVSLGLVRMANINPLVAVAKTLLKTPAPKGLRIHYCVYHSQLLMLARSHLEHELDAVFNRKQPETLWQQRSIKAALELHPDDEHCFVVLSSPVVEVGRDWSAHWAISEPSSMRALIQLVGRVLRHQELYPEKPNIHILSRNYRALAGKSPAYCRPGFESADFRLSSACVPELLEPEQWQPLTSAPRIRARKELTPKDNWVDLEHAHLHAQMFADAPAKLDSAASRWWVPGADLTGEFQKRTPFRRSTPQTDYFAFLEDEGAKPQMYAWIQQCAVLKHKSYFTEIPNPELAEGNSLWIYCDYKSLLINLAESMDEDVATLSRTFGAVSLRDLGDDAVWLFNEVLGFHLPVAGVD